MLSDEQQQQIKAERKMFGGIIKKGDPLYKNGFKVMIALVAIPLILLYELLCFCYEQLISAYINRYQLVQIIKALFIRIYRAVIHFFKQILKLFYSVFKAFTNIFKLIIWKQFTQVVKFCVSIWHMIDYVSNMIVNNFDRVMNLYTKCEYRVVQIQNYIIQRFSIFFLYIVDKYIIQILEIIVNKILRYLTKVWLCFTNLLTKFKQIIKKYMRKFIKIIMLCFAFALFTSTQLLCLINSYTQLIITRKKCRLDYAYILFSKVIYPTMIHISNIWILIDQIYQKVKYSIKIQCQKIKQLYINTKLQLQNTLLKCKQKFILACKRIYNSMCEQIHKLIQFVIKVSKQMITKIQRMIWALLIILRDGCLRYHNYLRSRFLAMTAIVWNGIKFIYKLICDQLHKLKLIINTLVLQVSIVIKQRILSPFSKYSIRSYNYIKDKFIQLCKFIKKLFIIQLNLLQQLAQFLKKQILWLFQKLYRFFRMVSRRVRSITYAIFDFIKLKQKKCKNFVYNMCQTFLIMSVTIALKALDLIDRLIQIQLNVIQFIFKYTVYVFRVVYRYVHQRVSYLYNHIRSGLKYILFKTIHAIKYLVFISQLYVKPIIYIVISKVKHWIKIAFIETNLILIKLIKKIIKASKYLYNEHLIPMIQYTIRKIVSIKLKIKHAIYIGLAKLIELLQILKTSFKSILIQIKSMFIYLRNNMKYILSQLISTLQWFKNELSKLYRSFVLSLIEMKTSLVNVIYNIFQQISLLKQSIFNQMYMIKQQISEIIMPFKESIISQCILLKMNMISVKNTIFGAIKDFRQYLTDNFIQPVKKSITESLQTMKEMLQNMKVSTIQFSQSIISSLKQMKQNLTLQVKSYKIAIQDQVRALRGR